jgi:isopentenyl-diphosphate delta-isomerase
MSDVELWDLLDDECRITGEVITRTSDEWPTGRFHLVVATCVVRPDGRVLMTRRAAGKEFPLTWEFPGGSALTGESGPAAAARELREETGLVVDESEVHLVGRSVEGIALVDLFVAAIAGWPDLRLAPDEVDRAEWVTMAEARRRHSAGEMAHPWAARLATARPALTETASGLLTRT